MDNSSAVQSFIKKAKSDSRLQQQLAECQLEKWGESHTPLDVDLKKVIQVAEEAGFTITEHDLIHAQCEQLDQFWTFEMTNSIVGRRSLERIQMQISGHRSHLNYYGYHQIISSNQHHKTIEIENA